MSLVQPQQAPERRPPPPPPLKPPGSTNNPFRRGPASPSLSPSVRTGSPAQRPTSTNPFLDNPFDLPATVAQNTSMSPPKPPSNRPPVRPGENEALLRGLTLEDRPAGGRGPPPGRSRHHQSNSTEARGQRGEEIDTLDIFADPPRRPTERRARRNSESSVVDHKTMDEDERKRRERRHRDRPKDSQGRPIPSSRSKKPSRRLDMIDKLDVTSIYGTGIFHHGGPYDALNPHRNRQNARRAPMQAFPKDSLNNAMGGSGPVNKNIDLERFHGHTEDSFKDFNTGSALKGGGSQQIYEPYVGPDTRPRGSSKSGPIYDRNNGFNPSEKVDQLHGDESLGLGTSTFLEGAPAARTAIQRRDSENDAIGLTRKKSLAQKIRGMNNRPKRYENGDLASPEPRYEQPTSPEVLNTGNSNGRPKVHERNPFFQDYDKEYEKKGESIRVAEQQKLDAEAAKAGAPPLTRSLTEGSPSEGGNTNTEAEPKSGGGFLNRVKSLRGGRGKSRA